MVDDLSPGDGGESIVGEEVGGVDYSGGIPGWRLRWRSLVNEELTGGRG